MARVVNIFVYVLPRGKDHSLRSSGVLVVESIRSITSNPVRKISAVMTAIF